MSEQNSQQFNETFKKILGQSFPEIEEPIVEKTDNSEIWLKALRNSPILLRYYLSSTAYIQGSISIEKNGDFDIHLN